MRLKHFRVQAITLLRLRLEGLEATVVEGGKEASVLVLKTMELRPTIKVRIRGLGRECFSRNT